MAYEILCIFYREFGTLWLHTSPIRGRIYTIFKNLNVLKCYVESKSTVPTLEVFIINFEVIHKYWKMAKDFHKSYFILFILGKK